MNTRILASVAFTIIGVMSLLRSITMLRAVAVVPAMAGHYEGSLALMALGYAIPTVALFAFGVGLITKRDRLARWLVPDDEVTDETDSASLAELAFAILGLYLLITALPWVASLTMSFIDYLIVGHSDDLRRSARLEPGRYLGYLGQLGAGIILFLSPKGVASWWRRRVAAD